MDQISGGLTVTVNSDGNLRVTGDRVVGRPSSDYRAFVRACGVVVLPAIACEFYFDPAGNSALSQIAALNTTPPLALGSRRT